MNWIIDALLVVLFSFVGSIWLCIAVLRKSTERGFMIWDDKLYKVTEVKDERQI